MTRVISFSGGRSSAMMMRKIWTPADVVIFANTGQEHEETLRFVRDCELHWGIPIVWVEPVVNQAPRKSTTHRVVSFDTACRDGSLFADVSSKFGLPGPSFPHCTRELKLRPIYSYLKSIGLKSGNFVTALGIRADEIDRMSPDADKRGLVYPLVKLGVTKLDVHEFFKNQPFNLNLPEHHGNCTWCWKKSLKKHLTNIVEHPEWYDVPEMLERRFQYAGPAHRKGKAKGPSRMFRGGRSVQDLREMAALPFNKFTDKMRDDLEASQGCEESCEVFT